MGSTPITRRHRRQSTLAKNRYRMVKPPLDVLFGNDVNPEDWLADVLFAVAIPGLTAIDLLPWN